MFWFVFLTLLMIAVIAVSVWKAISGRRLSTLWIMETAIRNDLPLDEVLEGHAYEFQGNRGRRLLGLSRCLREGQDLSDAMKTSSFRSLVPEEGRLAINVGTESGTLSPSVQDALSLATLRFERSRQQNTFSMMYLATVFNIIVLQTGFLMIFIIPKIKVIFMDFGVELPGPTTLFIGLADSFARYWYIGFLVMLILTIDGCRRFFQRRQCGVATYGFYHWINPQIYSVDLLRLLAVSASEGKPLIPTIEALARHHNDSTIRRKLTRVVRDAQQGKNIWDSFHEVRLINGWQTGVVKTAEPTGMLGDTLKRLANELDIEQYHRLQLRREAFRPMIIALLGFVVFLTAMAFFAPLVKLIGALA